jgi:hypothetical protein
MKDETDHFPGDKCYVFSQIGDSYCASYERVRVQNVEEIKRMRKKQA